MAGKTPVPDSATVWGLLGALSVNVSVPVTFPSFVGVKVTLTLQLFPGASMGPHVFAEIAKLVLAVMLLMSSVADPVLVTVTDLAALVVLTTTLPKPSEVRESVTMGPLPKPTSRLKTVPHPPLQLLLPPPDIVVP